MMKISKVLILLMAVSFVLAACGGTKNNGGNQTGAAGNEKVELKAWAWNVNVGALNEAVTSYQRITRMLSLRFKTLVALMYMTSCPLASQLAALAFLISCLWRTTGCKGIWNAFPKGFVNL